MKKVYFLLLILLSIITFSQTKIVEKKTTDKKVKEKAVPIKFPEEKFSLKDDFSLYNFNEYNSSGDYNGFSYIRRGEDGGISIILEPTEKPLKNEGVNNYFTFEGKRYPIIDSYLFSDLRVDLYKDPNFNRKDYSSSFIKPFKIDSTKKSFFYDFGLKRKDGYVYSYLNNGRKVDNTSDERVYKDNESFPYVFFMFFILMPLLVYMINNDKKIGKINFSLNYVQEIYLKTTFKVLLFWIFGAILLSSQNKYLFDSSYEVFKNISWINWIHDSHILFGFISIFMCMLTYYMFLDLIGLFFGEEGLLKNRLQIILLVSLIYSLIIGINEKEIVFFTFSFLRILVHLIVFILIYFTWWIIFGIFEKIFPNKKELEKVNQKKSEEAKPLEYSKGINVHEDMV